MSSVSHSIVFKGDLSPEVQNQIRDFTEAIISRGSFAYSVGSKLVAKEVDISKREKDGKPQARVVYEMTVDDSACFA